jgi:hypothetical protein
MSKIGSDTIWAKSISQANVRPDIGVILKVRNVPQKEGLYVSGSRRREAYAAK